MASKEDLSLFQSSISFPLTDRDVNDRPFLFSYLTAFQEIGSAHVDKLGYGYQALKGQDIIWVLVKVKIVINQNPPDSLLTLQTWPHPKSLLHFDRDYCIRDDKQVYVSAMSEWVLVDINTRKLIRPKMDLPLSFFRTEKALESDYASLIEFPCQDLQPSYQRKISYTQIDHNRHANNVKLCSMLLDAVPDMDKKELISAQIDFKNEARFGQSISAYAKPMGNEAYQVLLKDGEQIITDALFEFKHI